MDDVTLIQGDCVARMAEMPADSIDSIVCDPPYELNFMSQSWDRRGVAFDPETWKAAGRVLKPGRYMLAFGGTRTHHRLMCAIEDSGFQIKDVLMWIHGQGFPKGKSCLKPAWEPVILARKSGGKVPALEIDRCRINPGEVVSGGGNGKGNYRYGDHGHYTSERPKVEPHAAGRWPPNLCLSHIGGPDGCREVGVKRVKTGMGFCNAKPEHHGKGFNHSPPLGKGGHADPDGRETVAAFVCHPDCPVAELDRQSGIRKSDWARGSKKPGCFQQGVDETYPSVPYPDSGGASRFFYCPKASRRDRGPDNTHKTVKPHNLMRWLSRLITPPGGLILDPFMGSGSTGKAAVVEGFRFIGIDEDPASVKIARHRIESARAAVA